MACLSRRWNFHSEHAEYSPAQLGLSETEFASIRRDPAILHFSGPYKPWQFMSEPHYKHLYWRALALTPWKGMRAECYSARNALLRLVRLKKLKQQVRWYAVPQIRAIRAVLGKPPDLHLAFPPPSHEIVT